MGAIGKTVSSTNQTPVAASNADNGFRMDRTLVSKDQVDMFTKDYTPEQFLGDITNEWMGSLNDLKRAAEENEPKSLNIGGYTFQKMPGENFTDWQQTKGNREGKSIIMLYYQSTERVGSEYPVLQVGIAVTRRRGKVKAEIIRDGYTNKTRFW